MPIRSSSAQGPNLARDSLAGIFELAVFEFDIEMHFFDLNSILLRAVWRILRDLRRQFDVAKILVIRKSSQAWLVAALQPVFQPEKEVRLRIEEHQALTFPGVGEHDVHRLAIQLGFALQCRPWIDLLQMHKS